MANESFNANSATLTTLTPHLTVDNADAAIAFYKKAFGAVEMMRLPGPGGKLMHAHIKIGDSHLLLNDEFPEHGVLGPKSIKGSPVTLHMNVPDVDKSVDQAVKAGAKLTMPIADMFWGDRYGMVEDPFGHKWSIATPNKNMTAADIQAAMKAM